MVQVPQRALSYGETLNKSRALVKVSGRNIGTKDMPVYIEAVKNQAKAGEFVAVYRRGKRS